MTDTNDKNAETLPKKAKGGGSKPLDLTPEMFEEAGRLALTWRHLAGVLGVDLATVADRMQNPEFKQAYERGKLNSQTEVIRTLFNHMNKGSLKAAMFLAQAWCHLSTKHEVKTEDTHTVKYVVEVPPDQPTLEAWSQTYNAPVTDQRPN